MMFFYHEDKKFSQTQKCDLESEANEYDEKNDGHFFDEFSRV